MYSGTHVITYIASTCQERLSLLSRFHPCRAPSRAHVREGAAGSEGGEKRQNIFKSGFEIYFSFYVENGLFSALCHLSRPENGAKVQNRVGFGAFWVPSCKNGQKHRMNIICGSEKKCGTKFEKANWASKRRVAFRLLYVIAASLPVLKPAEFAVFCDRGFGFRNGIGERLLQKAVAFGVFCVPKPLWAALTAGCFLSGSVHFSFRIAVTDSGLPRFGKLQAKHWKRLIKSRLVFFENKVCSEHHERQNCGKAKCPHKSTGIGYSGECNEPFFANRLCICFVACQTIPLQKSAAKACFSAERIVIGLLSVSVTFALVLFVVRSVRSTKNPALNYNFRV